MKKLLVGAALLGLCFGAWAAEEPVAITDAPKVAVTTTVDTKAPVETKAMKKKCAKKAAKAAKKEAAAAAPEAAK